MYYYDAANQKPLSDSELDNLFRTGVLSREQDLISQNIFTFDNRYPTKYLENTDIYDITANDPETGSPKYEYYEEEVELVLPFSSGFDVPINADNEGNPITETTNKILQKGYRFVWTLIPKDKDIVRPILLKRLTTKKHVVEDAGVDIGNGVKIQSADSDRARMAQMTISQYYIDDHPEDTEFKGYLDALEFKVKDGEWISPITKEQRTTMFRAMAIRTFGVFARETAITKLIDTAYMNNDSQGMIDAYEANIDIGWPE